MVFENLPPQEVLARYDGPQALFYLDPPYWGGAGPETLPSSAGYPTVPYPLEQSPFSASPTKAARS
ncbi:hypothetical protein [Rhodovulum sulfidophilum]|uniref:hypothetical protein n=1 Tax=Rhodovulum sulfidophilum TaxID=35806 RepID=UPI00117A025C|nr:hypothetical protein [Rhodovulum sulfidophilum]MBL3554418.1 hypothetical protein [Rhodovulum sulfidophilum]